MNEIAFYLGNALVFPGWIALAAAPGWSGTRWLVRTGLLPGLVAALYALILVARFFGYGDGGGGSFFSLEGVVQLFDNETVVLIGWLHYLSFDLFVGSWIVADNEGWRRDGDRRISRLALVPVLFFTLMYGPVGLLLWLVIRQFRPGGHSATGKVRAS